ncbi:unnamed protein product [Ranitomeya imitator]|uniref:Metallophosphoesterase domain-containing protein 1 n=1 Tax=Ranitomeya imitator TaxID=111125 RepID=A0ABN9MIL6_9NEOB|nr:unnamed protein product [Ranitomeya imitator]
MPNKKKSFTVDSPFKIPHNSASTYSPLCRISEPARFPRNDLHAINGDGYRHTIRFTYDHDQRYDLAVIVAYMGGQQKETMAFKCLDEGALCVLYPMLCLRLAGGPKFEVSLYHPPGDPNSQPWFYGWGFNLPRGQALLDKWNLIPEATDILITHGPPLDLASRRTDLIQEGEVLEVNYGFLDWVPKKLQRVGCVELLNTVQRRVQPRLHVFGHIHEGYGVMADGTTTYVNSSVCTVNYQPVNPPIVIDLPNPRNT